MRSRGGQNVPLHVMRRFRPIKACNLFALNDRCPHRLIRHLEARVDTRLLMTSRSLLHKHQSRDGSATAATPPYESIIFLRLDSRASTINPAPFLVALDMSWLRTVRLGMSRGLEGQDTACLELLIQYFLAIGSPHAFEQLRRALPTCREPRYGWDRTTIWATS